jgi:hypothetical protein
MGLAALTVKGLDADNVPSVLENDAIVRRNGIYYNNRPLYAGQDNPDQRYYWVFAGDRPLVRFGGGGNLDGCFMPGFQRGEKAKWLLDFKTIEARYRPGWMEWVASDPEFPGVTVTFQALPLGTGLGMAARAQARGVAAGDKVVWLHGASYGRWVSFIDAMAADSQHVRYEGFDPEKARGNGVDVVNGVSRLDSAKGHKGRHTLLACGVAAEVGVADSGNWKTPAAFLVGPAGECPVARGSAPLVEGQPVTWIAKVGLGKDSPAPDVAGEFRAALARVERLGNRVVSKTPDARFDFMVRASVFPADCLWRKEAFGHGCLSAFVDPLLGWRSTQAGVAYGWHDRVYKAGQTFLASQVKTEDYRGEPALAKIIDNEELARYEGTYCHPGKDPRFHSKGRLIPNQNSTMYDMQSQFIDALVESWRFTADPEMEALLRPALELHLDYLARVFDPDGDGTYESFSNTFLTDSVWSNGGGTPDETAFAYRGHLAARDMARRAGDKAGVKRHEAKLALIRKGFFGQLWVAERGIPGAYREQGGHKRLHPDPWTPGLYLPMDCPGLLNDEQMASMAHFTEYGLQREPRSSGGVRLYPSNWVPSIWSNREKSPGDEYHMALGYCFAGMPEGAFELINGNISESAFESAVPGNLGVPYGSCGTDFGDCIGAFTRTVVSGVFGYRPDRPNGLVTIAPQFPVAWDHAEFKHPEFNLDYSIGDRRVIMSVELVRESAMVLELPVRGTKIKSVKLNGRSVKYGVKPGFGRTICVVRVPVSRKAELEIKYDGHVMGLKDTIATNVGDEVAISIANWRITKVLDAQGVLESPRIKGDTVTARVAANPGHHRVLVLADTGKLPQYWIYDFNIRDPKAEAYVAEKNLRQAPADAKWAGIDLAPVLNGRITDIFRQEYLSPRPETMSLRLAKDGYLIWNALYAGKLPPAIDLSNTRPRRPAPVYDAAVGDLKLDGEMTLEIWAQADLCDMPLWTSARLLELGDFSIDMINSNGRLLRLTAREPVWVGSSTFCGERTSHFAIVVRAGSKYGQLYRDGKRCIDQPAIDLAALKLGPTLRLGAGSKGENRLLGRIDRVAISRQAASAETLKNRPLDAPSLPGTVLDWRLPATGDAASVPNGVAGGPALQRQAIDFQPPKTLGEPLPVTAGMLTVPQGARFKWGASDAKDIAFTSLWDNWPRQITVPVNKAGDSVWLLVAGSSNPMQVRIANAVLRFEYADGVKEQLELVNPMNFWSLCPFLWSDYEYAREAFSLPKEKPSQVQLGSNCRAMVYGWKLRPGVELKSVTLESLSEEVIIGLMGLSVCTGVP